MTQDMLVRAVRHGATFTVVGVVLVNLLFCIFLPFVAYSILKTAAVAAKTVIFKTVSICKKVTGKLLNMQVKLCKGTLKLVSKLTKISMKMTRILIKQMMNTMRRMVGLSKKYCKLSFNTVMKFKKFTLWYVKKGMWLIKTELKLTIKTITKVAELLFKIMTETPKQMYKLIEVFYLKLFPGYVKIMIYFPKEYYTFMVRFIPRYFNFVYTMCKKVIEVNAKTTALMIFFQLVGVGIKFVSGFFEIGKKFIGDFVFGIDGIVNLIPSIGEFLDGDAIGAIPDKLIAFILNNLKFQTGLNGLLNASTTSLPLIEAKEDMVAEFATELNTLESRRTELVNLSKLVPDEEKVFEISILDVKIREMSFKLAEMKESLSMLIINRVFTFDELLLRTLFCNISFFKVYMEPPPIVPLVKIMLNFLFDTNLTPNFSVDLGFSQSLSFGRLVRVKLTVRAGFSIRPITLRDFFPGAAQAGIAFANWLDERLRSPDAYETVDDTKKSKIRDITKNPAAFVKFSIRIFIKFIEFYIGASGINLDITRFITTNFSASISVRILGGIKIGISSPNLGAVLRRVGSGAATIMSKALDFIFRIYGSAVGFIVNLLSSQLQNVIFSSLNFAYPDNFDWLG